MSYIAGSGREQGAASIIAQDHGERVVLGLNDIDWIKAGVWTAGHSKRILSAKIGSAQNKTQN